MKKQAIETLCVQGGYCPGNGEPRQIPIIQSTTFKYDTSEDMGRLFDLEASGYFAKPVEISNSEEEKAGDTDLFTFTVKATFAGKSVSAKLKL